MDYLDNKVWKIYNVAKINTCQIAKLWLGKVAGKQTHESHTFSFVALKHCF
jgi:hypothetical protein